MKLTIKKRGLLQYITIYLLLAFTGSIGFRINNDLCIGIAMVLFLYVFLTRRSSIPQHIYLFIILLTVALFGEIVLTSGGVSVVSIISIISRFAIVSAAIYSDEGQFIDRFVRMSVLLATVSLFGFVGVQVVPFLFKAFFPSITETVVTPYGTQFARYYGGYIFAFTESATRNIGIYHEPGLYAIVLNATLYMLLYKGEQIFVSKRTYKMMFLIVVIAIISCMSTMGYIICVGMLICRYFLQRSYTKLSTRIVALSVLLMLAVYNSVAGTDSFIYKNLVSKITNSSGEIDLFVSTGKSRIISLLADLNVFLAHPFGIGYLKYNNTWSSFLIDNTISDTSSCVGITQTLAILGIIITGIIMGYYFILSRRNQKLNESMAFWLMFFIIVLSQPQIWYPPMICLLFIDPNRLRPINS